MANEITIVASLQVVNGNSQYNSRPTGFKANQSAVGGPSPGMLTATTTGTDVDFSKLTQPGWCRIVNLDAVNYVEIGVYDPDSTEYLPFAECLPGEPALFRLSRFIGKELGNAPGTGTIGSGVTLRIKGVGGACRVVVEAFET